MPKFMEEKLKKKYGKKSSYKIMNSLGMMHGNKETEMGHDMKSKFHKSLRKKRMMEE